MAGLLAVLILGALVVREAADGRIFMLQRLEMTGDVQKVPLARLKEAVEPAAAGKTFFTVDLKAVRDAAETVPWVQYAAVRRVWPDALMIDVTVYEAAAVYEDGRLVSGEGQLFSANPDEGSETAGAPTFRGEAQVHMHWVSILYLQSALAAVTLALRYGVAESEIWLKSTRSQTQHAAIRQTLFTRPRFRSYLSDMRLAVSGNAKNFFFCASFWLCQTIPATIMMLYSPTILHDMTGSDDAILQMLLLYGFFLAGVLPSGSPYLANRPKLVLATTFVTMALGLLGVLFFAKTSLLLTNISFILFAVSYGLQAPLDFIYPNQLFATQVRGSLVGAVTAISRIGATGAAFIFPVLEPYFELSALFGAGLFVLALGFMIAVKFAPADRVFHQNC